MERETVEHGKYYALSLGGRAADADYRRRDRNRRHHHRVRYLRHKFVINEVAWLSGRGRRSSDGI